jgi:hypothetical protein
LANLGNKKLEVWKLVIGAGRDIGRLVQIWDQLYCTEKNSLTQKVSRFYNPENELQQACLVIIDCGCEGSLNSESINVFCFQLKRFIFMNRSYLGLNLVLISIGIEILKKLIELRAYNWKGWFGLVFAENWQNLFRSKKLRLARGVCLKDMHPYGKDINVLITRNFEKNLFEFWVMSHGCGDLKESSLAGGVGLEPLGLVEKINGKSNKAYGINLNLKSLLKMNQGIWGERPKGGCGKKGSDTDLEDLMLSGKMEIESGGGREKE